MLGINPAMVTFMVKSKLDEIIAGVYPEGFILKEKTENKICLTAGELLNSPEIKTNKLYCSITYKNVEIILQND